MMSAGRNDKLVIISNFLGVLYISQVKKTSAWILITASTDAGEEESASHQIVCEVQIRDALINAPLVLLYPFEKDTCRALFAR